MVAHKTKEMIPSDWLVNYNAKLSKDRELFEDYKTKLVVIGVALILVVALHNLFFDAGSLVVLYS